MKQKKQSNIKS